jgi:methionyl-tRNA formyltransferase
MKVVFFTKGLRGLECLRSFMQSDYVCAAIILHPKNEEALFEEYIKHSKEINCPIHFFDNPNSEQSVEILRDLSADVFVLAGYGKIIKESVIDLPKTIALNLHGGMLPECRGSSPLNWSLIEGHAQFGISIIQVKPGVDTGPVLARYTQEINEADTILDLHTIVNQQFPKMLMTVLDQVQEGAHSVEVQDDDEATYYARRFPSDGLILWDQMSSLEIERLVRALTDPYPCAFTYSQGRKILIKKVSFPKIKFRGGAGRVFRIKDSRLLVSTNDNALWIEEACTEDGQPWSDFVHIYDECLTLKGTALKLAQMDALTLKEVNSQ